MERLAAITKEIRIEKGKPLFREGKEANELHVLKEGAVELTMKAEEDFEIPVARGLLRHVSLGCATRIHPFRPMC